MKQGYLKEYFKGVISKRLSAVETRPEKSNQHEFNATMHMRRVFGDDDQKFKSDFLYICDDEEKVRRSSDFLTWYDARRKHPTRTEYRLYYPSSEVTLSAQEGDSLFICLKQDGSILCIIGERNSTITSQLYWLFGLTNVDNHRFVVSDKFEYDSDNLEYAVRRIFEEIGIEYKSDIDSYLLDKLIGKFGHAFPKTAEFSEYARSLVTDLSPIEDPDSTLFKWYSMEERLFYIFEKHLIQDRVEKGFVNDGIIDVDDFIQFSLSVQNRRKSRAGLSLENHVCALLDINQIFYAHGKYTEKKSKPDFIFPSIESYHDESYPISYLTMLGAKTTCKDRWRQVLPEADRIKNKHVLTLEPSISENQTNEMIKENVQLVLPFSIHHTYTPKQQEWIWTMKHFISLVRDRQQYYLKR